VSKIVNPDLPPNRWEPEGSFGYTATAWSGREGVWKMPLWSCVGVRLFTDTRKKIEAAAKSRRQSISEFVRAAARKEALETLEEARKTNWTGEDQS
jgi:hypothetical protein